MEFVSAVVDSVTLIALNVVEVRDQEKQEYQGRLAFYDVLHVTRTAYSSAQSARNNKGCPDATSRKTNIWVTETS